MAPPPGTLRVGRYFAALIVLLGLLYLVVFFPGQRHTPKLGIDLVGGIRVIYTAQTPKGSPAPTSDQMDEARQILEDRINTTGVTGSTVVVQGNDQLVVEIPDATQTDIANLGSAAILNFRGAIGPAQAVSCTTKKAAAHAGSGTASSGAPTSGSSGSASPGSANSPSSAASSASTSAKTSASTAPASSSSSAAGFAAPQASKPNSPASSTSGSTKSGSPKSGGKTSTAPGGSASGSATGTGSASTSPSASSSSAATRPVCDPDPLATLVKTDPSMKGKIPNSETCPSPTKIVDNQGKPAPCVAYDSLSSTQQTELASAVSSFKCSAGQTEPDNAEAAYIACDDGSTYGTRVAYLLGHVVVKGQQISSAQSVAPDVTGNGGSSEWTVSLTFDNAGADNWHAWTSKYHTTQNSGAQVLQTSSTAPCGASALPCSDFVGFTLDGQVISAPVTLAVLDRQTSISGGNPAFTQTTADALAQQLNYGKLPISFRADSNQQVSATLGSAQLKAAFLAGGIGLILVVLYSLLYYRGLGLVTIASLIVSAGLTYAMLVILGTQVGFTLDLAGIAGFIVALGITADSFVVFFERLKDEVHEGRSARVAVPRAWVRARRTILSADTVSFLAAAILYYFASADVKGFAFTLGLSTILDLIVVFLFTHPIVSALSRSRAFGSKRFSGLDAVRVGGIVDTDDDLPASRRRTRPARASGSARGASTATTTLRKGEAPAPADDEPVEDTTEVVDDHDDVGTDPGTDEPLPPSRPRRRTTPEPGSAAERAAQRRARMREQQQRDADGEDSD